MDPLPASAPLTGLKPAYEEFPGSGASPSGTARDGVTQGQSERSNDSAEGLGGKRSGKTSGSPPRSLSGVVVSSQVNLRREGRGGGREPGEESRDADLLPFSSLSAGKERQTRGRSVPVLSRPSAADDSSAARGDCDGERQGEFDRETEGL